MNTEDTVIAGFNKRVRSSLERYDSRFLAIMVNNAVAIIEERKEARKT